MAAKPLPSQAYLRECFDYDPVTGIVNWRNRLESHFKNIGIMRRFNSRCAGNIAGGKSKASGYLIINMERVLWRLHRLIWKMETGQDHPEIDHKNRNREDNRWGNLRAASPSQNSTNSTREAKSGAPRGIRFRYNKWYARLQVRGQTIHIGTFKNLDNAKAAYREAAIKHHGEFASFDRH